MAGRCHAAGPSLTPTGPALQNRPLENVCCAVKRWGVFKAHCWLLFLLVVFSPASAFPVVNPLAVEVDAIPVSADYIVRTWGVDEGLPSSRVMGLTQTPDGYLWVATLDGVARFDGVRFTTFLSEA